METYGVISFGGSNAAHSLVVYKHVDEGYNPHAFEPTLHDFEGHVTYGNGGTEQGTRCRECGFHLCVIDSAQEYCSPCRYDFEHYPYTSYLRSDQLRHVIEVMKDLGKAQDAFETEETKGWRLISKNLESEGEEEGVYTVDWPPEEEETPIRQHIGGKRGYPIRRKLPSRRRKSPRIVRKQVN